LVAVQALECIVDCGGLNHENKPYAASALYVVVRTWLLSVEYFCQVAGSALLHIQLLIHRARSAGPCVKNQKLKGEYYVKRQS